MCETIDRAPNGRWVTSVGLPEWIKIVIDLSLMLFYIGAKAYPIYVILVKVAHMGYRLLTISWVMAFHGDQVGLSQQGLRRRLLIGYLIEDPTPFGLGYDIGHGSSTMHWVSIF